MIVVLPAPLCPRKLENTGPEDLRLVHFQGQVVHCHERAVLLGEVLQLDFDLR